VTIAGDRLWRLEKCLIPPASSSEFGGTKIDADLEAMVFRHLQQLRGQGHTCLQPALNETGHQQQGVL
jgi:hypothetical protein